MAFVDFPKTKILNFVFVIEPERVGARVRILRSDYRRGTSAVYCINT